MIRNIVGMIEPGSNARLFRPRMLLAEWLERPWRCKLFGHSSHRVTHDMTQDCDLTYLRVTRDAWECKREGCCVWMGWADA